MVDRSLSNGQMGREVSGGSEPSFGSVPVEGLTSYLAQVGERKN